MNENPIDAWSAIQKTRETQGWKLIMGRYADEGDILLQELMSLNVPGGAVYTKRDLLAHQLNSLGRLKGVIDQFELEAKSAEDRDE